MDLTTALALWGAALSTGVAGYQIYQSVLRQRREVRVSSRVHLEPVEDQEPPSPYIVVAALNAASRPIQIDSMGMWMEPIPGDQEYPEHMVLKSIPVDGPLPKRLEDGQSVSGRVAVKPLGESYKRHPREFVPVTYDAFGNSWRGEPVTQEVITAWGLIDPNNPIEPAPHHEINRDSR